MAFIVSSCLDHKENPSLREQTPEDGWVELSSPEGRIDPLNDADRIEDLHDELHDPAKRARRKQQADDPDGGVSAVKIELDPPSE